MRSVFCLIVLLLSLHCSGQFQLQGFVNGAPSSTGFQAETTNYLNAETTAGKTYTVAQQDSLDRFFKDLKGISNPRYTTYNVISRIIFLYVVLNGVSAYDRINMVTPGTYDAVDVGSPSYSTGSKTVTFDGASNYWDCGFIPNNTDINNISGLGIYRTDATDDGNATAGVAHLGNTYIINRSDAFNEMYVATNNGSPSSGSHAVKSVKWSSYSSATVLNYYVNGANVKSTTGLTYSNAGDKSLYLGAYHGGAGPVYANATTVVIFLAVSGAWSDNEVQAMYNALVALKGSFGITIP